MRHLATIPAILLLLTNCLFASSGITYTSPLPNSQYHLLGRNIILRADGLVDPSSLNTSGLITVTGSLSGEHTGNLLLSDDGQTILFHPDDPFETDENVVVQLNNGLRKKDGAMVSPLTFSFSTTRGIRIGDPGGERNSVSLFGPFENLDLDGIQLTSPSSFRSAISDSLPADFPFIQTTIYGVPSTGKLFISNFRFNQSPFTPYLMILDDNGIPEFYRAMRGVCTDFKPQPNRTLSYFDISVDKYYVMNEAYEVIDSVVSGNGYVTDEHELRILPNGHYVLMAYDPQRVNVDTTGETMFNATGLILQELDDQKRVVFQWRSWDHFLLSDYQGSGSGAASLDYVHGNAIDIDTDGNWLISSRHLSEITKINRETGEVMWRLGGKRNEFTFLNDSIGFSFQHAIRRLGNGNVTLFDNGNGHTPSFSRAVEYELDENAKTARLVWEYRNTPDVYGFAMGYAQRLSNGNTLISWGAASTAVTEVNADGEKVFELSFDSDTFSYRAFRYEWPLPPPEEVPQVASLSQNFPNPFNSRTRVTVRLPYDAGVSLKVYDLLGREIMTVMENELHGAGTFDTSIDMSGFATGVYFYRLQANSFAETRKMMYLR